MRDVRTLKRADVYRGEEKVGALERTRGGCTFTYLDTFFAAHRQLPGGIAAQFPYATQRFEQHGDNLHAFFAGLLPEGLRLKAIVKASKTSESDMFSLLLALGGDTTGDVTVVPEGAGFRDSTRLAEPAAESFAELWTRAVDRARFGATVAGVQDKISPSTMSLPITGRSKKKAYILKLNPAQLPRLVENEFFFMKCARACDVLVADCALVHDRDQAAGLLVERFDRRWNIETKALTRLRQEDACQLLSRFPQDKYALPCSTISEALAVCTAPLPARARFIELVAFSYLICNGDLHAKNVSVLADATGLALSPAYDLVSTLPYGDRRMALQFEGRDDNLKRRDFINFGSRNGVAEAWVTKRLDQLVETVAEHVPRLGEIGLGAKATADLERTMHKRLRQLA